MPRSMMLLFLTCISTHCLAEDFLVLAEKAPPGGNAVMAVDVAQVLSSPIAKENGWDKKFNEGGFDRPIHFPPEASKMMTVSQLDIVRNFKTNWKVSLFDLLESIPLRLVARAEGGYLDKVSGFDAVWIPSDAYVFDGSDNVLCMQSPANRQAIVRWQGRKPSVILSLSDFLVNCLGRTGKGPQIVMAMDLKNAIQPHRVREALKASGFPDEHGVKLEDLQTLIESLEGVVVEITLTDSANVRTQIDFEKDVNLNSATARALITATLENSGMSLPEIKKHKLSVVGKSIIIEGDIDTGALRQILSIMAPASTKFSSLKDENLDESSADDMAKNSLAYFQSIQSYIKDLKSKSRASSRDSYWISRYVTMIDKLPILHVDEDLLEFGQKLSETLRMMSGTIKQTKLSGNANARSMYVDSGYDSGYGYSGYNYPSSGSRTLGAVNAKSNAASSASMTKTQGFTLIDNATNEIRREMTKRYNIEF